MQLTLQQETERLVQSWNQHAPGWLGSYLVAGVEDPRINLQSILSRHFLIGDLSWAGFTDLMVQEYRFGAAMNWLMKLVQRAADAEELDAIRYALQRGADNAEGLEIPLFLVQAYAQLPCAVSGLSVPNYIEAFLCQALRPRDRLDGAGSCLNTFQALWREALVSGCTRAAMVEPGANNSPTPQSSLLEPACGSANDYRFLQAYGIANWFNYTGFDLCQTNIDNARALFPNTHFETGNVFEIDAEGKTYDLCIIHDLLEHLSLEGMQTAVQEICRVTRRGICLGFFQMDEIRDHLVRPVEDYHWNLLSMKRMRELFEPYGFSGQVIQIESFLKQQVGCEETHNPNAYTFLLRASG